MKENTKETKSDFATAEGQLKYIKDRVASLVTRLNMMKQTIMHGEKPRDSSTEGTVRPKTDNRFTEITATCEEIDAYIKRGNEIISEVEEATRE